MLIRLFDHFLNFLNKGISPCDLHAQSVNHKIDVQQFFFVLGFFFFREICTGKIKYVKINSHKSYKNCRDQNEDFCIIDLEITFKGEIFIISYTHIEISCEPFKYCPSSRFQIYLNFAGYKYLAFNSQYRAIFDQVKANKTFTCPVKPKISIITPSLNQGKYIEKAILSIIEQDYENLEYIIIDGGSTDDTLEVIKKYESKITYFISEPDLGQTDAINKGLKIASGEIFTWLNADDFYEPHTLLKVAGYINSNPEKDVFCGMSNIIGVDGTIQRQTNGVVIQKRLAQTIGWPVINQPETFFRKGIIEKTGLLSISLRYNMDKELWIKYLLVYGQSGIFKTSELWVNFLHHDSSKSMNEVSGFTPERDAIFLGIAKWAKLDDVVSLFISS
jgi:hypothetical protein